MDDPVDSINHPDTGDAVRASPATVAPGRPVVDDPPITLEQILAGFTPPPGPEGGEEATRRYWGDYYEKRRRFMWNPPSYTDEQIEQYAGKTLVWAPDGSRILAVGRDPYTIQQQIEALGLESWQFVYVCIPNHGDEARA